MIELLVVVSDALDYETAIKEIHDYLSGLSDETFDKLLDDHKDGDFAVILRETGALLAHFATPGKAIEQTFEADCDKAEELLTRPALAALPVETSARDAEGGWTDTTARPAPAANTEGLRDSQRLDWIEHVMTYDDNYVEVYLSGLRNQTGKATAFQVEVNPEKIATLNAPTLREAIDAAQGKWEREVTEEHAARTPPPAEPGLRSRMEKLADMYEADGVAHVARDIRAELGYWNTKYEFKSPEDVEKRFPSLFRNSPHSKKAGNDQWVCDDCMMRDMTEAEGDAHHASTGHSVSSK